MQKHVMFIFNIKFLEKTEVSGIAEHFSKWGLTGDLKLGRGRGGEGAQETLFLVSPPSLGVLSLHLTLEAPIVT